MPCATSGELLVASFVTLSAVLHVGVFLARSLFKPSTRMLEHSATLQAQRWAWLDNSSPEYREHVAQRLLSYNAMVKRAYGGAQSYRQPRASIHGAMLTIIGLYVVREKYPHTEKLKAALSFWPY